jgi:hypothetical protein
MSPHDGAGAQRESGATVEDPDYIVLGEFMKLCGWNTRAMFDIHPFS